EGRAADRVHRPELGDAGDGHAPLRPLARHPDLVADLEVLLPGAARVDDDLVGAYGPLPGLQRGGVRALARLESPAEVRLVGRAELLAVPADQLHEVTLAPDVE